MGERTCYHFRGLLVQWKGALYEDAHVLAEMSIQRPAVDCKADRRRCCFELTVTNRTSGSLQQVKWEPCKASQHQSVDLHIRPLSGVGSSLPVKPRQQAIFQGQ